MGAVLITSAVQIGVAKNAKAASGTTLRWGMMEKIDSLNPFIGVNDNAYIFYGLVYDYLVAVDQDLKPKPNLALSWNIVPDASPYGSVWQYNLTHDALWHDGEAFTADDVVFTFEYQIGTNYDSMWAYQPYTILIQSVEKIDDYTVRMHFKDIHNQPAPCPFGDKLMIPIVPKHIWGPISPYDAGFSYENYKPIGTGPFMCTDNTKNEFLGGSSIVLKTNHEYHGIADYGEQIKFDTLILEFYLEPSAMTTAIETGAIDMGLFNAPNYESIKDYLANHPDAPIGTYAGLTCTGYSIDLEVNMLKEGGTNCPEARPSCQKSHGLRNGQGFHQGLHLQRKRHGGCHDY